MSMLSDLGDAYSSISRVRQPLARSVYFPFLFWSLLIPVNVVDIALSIAGAEPAQTELGMGIVIIIHYVFMFCATHRRVIDTGLHNRVLRILCVFTPVGLFYIFRGSRPSSIN